MDDSSEKSMSVCKCGHMKVFHILSGRCAWFIKKLAINPIEKYEEREEDAN